MFACVITLGCLYETGITTFVFLTFFGQFWSMFWSRSNLKNLSAHSYLLSTCPQQIIISVMSTPPAARLSNIGGGICSLGGAVMPQDAPHF